MTAERHPRIDRDRCVGCGRCLSTCSEGVFRFGLFSTKPKVVHPERCLDDCDKCARMCPAEAVTILLKK